MASSSGFCLFYSSWCWCEIPNSLQPAAFLSSHRRVLDCFSLSPFQTLKLLAITIIQRSLPAPGILQNLLSTVGLHPISLEDILEKGCRGETFPDVFIQKILFLLPCLVKRILGQEILGWKYFHLRTRTAPFPRITEPEFGLCSQTLLGYSLTSLCTDNLNYLSCHPSQQFIWKSLSFRNLTRCFKYHWKVRSQFMSYV